MDFISAEETMGMIMKQGKGDIIADNIPAMFSWQKLVVRKCTLYHVYGSYR